MRRIVVLVGGGVFFLAAATLLLIFSYRPEPANAAATSNTASAAGVGGSVVELEDQSVVNTVAYAMMQATLVQDTQPDQGCINCHTNVELLQLLAEEDDTPAPPSEGSG